MGAVKHRRRTQFSGNFQMHDHYLVRSTSAYVKVLLDFPTAQVIKNPYDLETQEVS